LSHQAGDERHITRQAIELRDDDIGLALFGVGERRSKGRTEFERVGALAAFLMNAASLSLNRAGGIGSAGGLAFGIFASAEHACGDEHVILSHILNTLI